jgi:hypothetical protein
MLLELKTELLKKEQKVKSKTVSEGETAAEAVGTLEAVAEAATVGVTDGAAEATALGATEGTGEEQQHLLRLMEPSDGSADGVREFLKSTLVHPKEKLVGAAERAVVTSFADGATVGLSEGTIVTGFAEGAIVKLTEGFSGGLVEGLPLEQQTAPLQGSKGRSNC